MRVMIPNPSEAIDRYEGEQSEAIAHLHGALEAGIGHVPVEAFAAAMTALEQAEKELDEAA